ncbi:hypothetical protein ABTX61_06515 [Amycolatopsis japonica]|uniref:hypothetical protein n=1 Tax=Amycolatopsis japonica TaxID=208439 RepID=UPI0033276299
MKKWTTRVTTGLMVAGMALALQSAPAMAEEADDSTAEVTLTEEAPEVGTTDCGGWRGATAGYSGWKVSTSDCAWISPASKKNPQHRRYKWAAQAGSNTRICVQVQGHYWSTKKKKSVATWTTAGCGTSGTVVVRWSGPPKKGGGYLGLAATPKVRAKVQPGFLGVGYKWA